MTASWKIRKQRGSGEPPPPNNLESAGIPPLSLALLRKTGMIGNAAPHLNPEKAYPLFKESLLLKDPRLFQIAALSGLLAFGWFGRAFETAPAHFAAIVAAALGAQWLGSLLNAIKFDIKSPLITALSLTLLLRADTAWPLALAAAIAIGSKFALRLNGKHIFNPANAGIVAMVLLTDAAWTTPGQWGTAVWLAAILAGAGLFVTYRAARLDVPLIFLGAYGALMFARALWLGDPLSIPLLRLENGALILFAFFMISDPKTTPDGIRARAAFAAGTAALAYLLTFHFFLTDGLFYALAIMCLIRPLMELFDKAAPYQWGQTTPQAWSIKPMLDRIKSASEKPSTTPLKDIQRKQRDLNAKIQTE